MQKVRTLLQNSKNKSSFVLSEFDPSNYRIVLVYQKARNALASALRIQRETGSLKLKSKLSEVCDSSTLGNRNPVASVSRVQLPMLTLCSGT